MLFLFVLAFIICVVRVQYVNQGFNAEYLSRESTNAIKGIFIILVFIQHIIPYILDSGYVVGEGFSAELFYFIKGHINQWIVAMFLFYSGYGVMESIRCKGEVYVKQMPKKRILKVFVDFAVAVSIYIVLALLLNQHLSVAKCLLAFTGWESVGNSNWYIFVIIILYLITYCCAVSLKCPQLIYFILFVTLIVAGVLCCFKPTYWSNTILCYVAGLFYSHYRSLLEPLFKSKYYIILILLVLSMSCLDRMPFVMHSVLYNVFAVLFCFMVLLATMKLRIKNEFLIWLGKNLFPIYIYQRIPMIILSSIYDGYFAASRPICYTLTCFIITLLIACIYKQLEINFKRLLAWC